MFSDLDWLIVGGRGAWEVMVMLEDEEAAGDVFARCWSSALRASALRVSSVQRIARLHPKNLTSFSRLLPSR